MLNTAGLLDAAKYRQAIPSDYRLAQVAGITKAAVSGYRHGKSHPDDATTQRLAALAGVDPEWAVACIQAERQRTDSGRAIWHRIAQRLESAAAAASTAILSAGTTGGPDAPARGVKAPKARTRGGSPSYTLPRVAHGLRHIATAALSGARSYTLAQGTAAALRA